MQRNHFLWCSTKEISERENPVGVITQKNGLKCQSSMWFTKSLMIFIMWSFLCHTASSYILTLESNLHVKYGSLVPIYICTSSIHLFNAFIQPVFIGQFIEKVNYGLWSILGSCDISVNQ